MKKVLSILLCLCMALSLMACGSSSEAATTAPVATTQPASQFRVGYARENITPDKPTGLAGYGNIDERKHTEVLDYLYLTCVAISDEYDGTLLLYSADLCSISDATVGTMRARISSQTGVPKENIMFNSSHTHSAPRGEGISAIMDKAVIKAAENALADQKPATMYFGTANTSGINFVRHYFMNDGSVVTDNHGTTAGKTIASHTTEVDEQMRVVQFKREGGKDVILANWQSHPHITGGSTKTSMSADIIGAFRTYLEQDVDCLFAYYQGGAGNINPTSRVAEENANAKKEWKVHGQMLAKTCQEALSNMTQVQTGQIRVHTETFRCDTNKADMNLAAVASIVKAYYEDGHTIAETKTFAESYGLASLYHANAVASRGGLGDHYDIEISALSIGEFGWALAPYEMFDASAKYVRDNSPFAYTFVTGYSNGANGYFPTEYCYEYGAYESDTTKVAKGTAEAICERFLEILADLKAQ